MYKRLLIQRTTVYNGQWYCFLCESTLQSLENAMLHWNEAHSDINTQIHFLNKHVKFSDKECKELLNDGIVIRLLPYYFCVNCQCFISFLTQIDHHFKEEKHQICIKTSTVWEDSTNDQHNLNDSINDKQNNISRSETLEELINKLELKSELDSMRIESITELSNAFMTNEIIKNSYYHTNYPQKIKIYKRFLAKQITRYKGQWYCYLCNSMLSLENAERHSQEAHLDISTQVDFLDKSVELSYTRCEKLLNHGIVIGSVLPGYFCTLCQCTIPSLDHIDQHSKGKQHQTYKIGRNVSIIPKDSTNDQQQNSNDNKSSKKNNISVIVEVPKNYANEKFLTQMQLCYKNNLVKELADSPAFFKSYKEDRNNDNILQIDSCADMAFCSLCDKFIHKTRIKEHLRDEKDSPVLSVVLKVFQQEEHRKCIIYLDEKKEIIKPLQISSKKLDEIMCSKSNTEIIITYTCAYCHDIIENNDILNHEKTKHINKMKRFREYFREYFSVCSSMNKYITLFDFYIMFKCSFCNEIIHGILSLQIHSCDYRHKKYITSLTTTKKMKYNIPKDIHNYFEPVEFLSIISFKSNEVIMEPVIYIKNHPETFLCLHLEDFDNPIQEKFTYICIVCECTFYSTETLIDHLRQNKKHFKYFENIIFRYYYMSDTPTSKELDINETQTVKSPVRTEDRTNMLEEYNVNETQVNRAQNHISNQITAANTDSNTDDTLYQNGANNSGLFLSSDIATEINMLIQELTEQPVSNMSVPNCYNKMYQKRYLDLEEIMFSCSEMKLKEIRSNLQFYILFSDTKNMLCLVCHVIHSYDIYSLCKHIYHEQHIEQFKKLHESDENFDEEKLNLLRELIEIEIDSILDRPYFKCYACESHEIELEHCDKSKIESHIRTVSHKVSRSVSFKQVENILKEFETLYYNIEYFACMVCMETFEKIDFMKHLDTMHYTQVFIMKDNLRFDFCITCSILWYTEDFIETRKLHCQEEEHLIQIDDFEISSLPQTLQKLLKNIDETIADLLKLSNDALNDPKLIQLKDALKNILESDPLTKLPGSYMEMYTVGSRITGLALPNSDVDIYLTCGYEYTEDTMIKNRSKEIQYYLQSNSKNWKIESILDKSRTSIIKVKHKLIGLHCNISFTNSLSVENSKLIRSFIVAYPLCQKLILFLKKWLLLGCLAGSDGISGYALAWLVIFYLQVKYKIPSVATLIRDHKQSKIVSGWETGVGDICTNSSEITNLSELPIHQLLLEFFEYYANFDYRHHVICPLLGVTCHKEFFTEISLMNNSVLSDVMALYVAQLRTKKPKYFRVDSPMCVQDPFDLSHNLTKAVPILILQYFKVYCNESASILRDITEINNITRVLSRFQPAFNG